MNTHPYLLTQMNNQRTASLQMENNHSHMAKASRGKKISLEVRLQEMIAKAMKRWNNHQEPCCTVK